MARLRSPEKRRAILEATVEEIAQSGLGASTSKIARRAGIAEGTLFTYFSTKEDLLNQLYLELKTEVYERVNKAFPKEGDLRVRIQNIWTSYLDWAIENPLKRKASVQLNVSDILSAETRASSTEQRRNIHDALHELGQRCAIYDLPPGFAASSLSAMQEAAMDLIAKQPKQRKLLTERAFDAFWRIFS